MRVVLLDYGLGNLRSVQKAFEYLGAKVLLTDDPRRVAQADRLVLPGVGAFAAGVAGLHQRGLIAPIREGVRAGVPLLGICLGMQLLFEESEEVSAGFSPQPGLGLLAGRVVRLAAGQWRVPHVGWNQVQPVGSPALLRGIAPGAYAYFVHSYVCQPADPNVVQAVTDYGGDFASVVGRGNLWGVQFHPEKSQQIGLRLLQNFLEGFLEG